MAAERFGAGARLGRGRRRRWWWAGGAGLALLVALAAVRWSGQGVAVPPVPQFRSQVERGQWLFVHKGCVGCHGPDGKGGVVNPNSIRGTVPELQPLAERLMLFEPEDAQAAVAALERGAPGPVEPAPFANWPRFLAQYQAVHTLIERGNPSGKRDAQGPPPIAMPPWGQLLTSREIDALIAYLITRYDWQAGG